MKENEELTASRSEELDAKLVQATENGHLVFGLDAVINRVFNDGLRKYVRKSNSL